MNEYVTTTVRLRGELYDKIKELHLNMSAIVDVALEQAIQQILEHGDDPALRFVYFNRGKTRKQTVEQGGL